MLANTPLEPVIDLAQDQPLDIVVVMMTPECRPGHHAPPDAPDADLVQAVVDADWALLASYRVAFEMLDHRNRLAEAALKFQQAAQQTGDQSLLMTSAIPRQVAMPTVIAPAELMPLDWIIDYETANHQALFAQGRADAERALARRRPP